MDRREFMQALLGGIATVAIATKLAPKFPKYEYKTYGMGFAISREEIEESYAEIGARMHAALAKSMSETRDQVAMRVFQNHETDYLHVEGISREEFFRA